MNKKPIIIFLVLITSFVLFSACTQANNAFDSTSADQLEQKNQSFSLSGILSKNGDIFFITDESGVIHDIESYSVEFDNFLGKQVTVNGQYSGNTFFVAEITQ